MATIVVAAVGTALTEGLTGSAAVFAAAAVAAAAMGAAYVDSRYVYPKLFPTDDPQQPILAGIDQMTGDDGAPGHTCWGRMAMVGGHVLFFENQEDIQNTQTTKKGPSVTMTKRIADLGVGMARNLIAGIDQIFADQKVFWRRDPNNVFWADYRATITTAAGTPTKLRIEPTSGDVMEFVPIFAEGDVVRVTGMITAPNGLWRVKTSLGMGSGASGFGQLELTALESQTPVAGTAGTSAAPMEIRRMDSINADDYLMTGQFGVFAAFFARGITLHGTGGQLAGTAGPVPGITRMHWWHAPNTIFPVGRAVMISGVTPTWRNGRWRVRSAQLVSLTIGGQGWAFELDPLDNQVIGSLTTPTHGTETQPARVELVGEEGFLEPSTGQELQVYLGTEDQGPDPDLAAIYGVANTHGYRGLARFTVRNLNLSNWGDRAPSFSAAVMVAAGHTTHDVIRTLMREAFRGDDSRYDLSKLEPNPMLGYTRRGVQPTSQTLQPVAIAFGIECQEQGPTWVFFKADKADLHVLGEDDFGAWIGRANRPEQSFAHKRLQTRVLPRRLLFYYRDPLNNFTRTDKLVRVDLPEDPSDEDVAVDVDPLVLYPWDAQNAAHRIYAQYVVGRDQGVIVVPPSRLDILCNDRVTFTALHWNEEVVTIINGFIDHTTRIGGIEPFSVSIEVTFEAAGNCRLVDDGNGELIGIPDSVGVTTNMVDYDTGDIDFEGDDPIVEAVIRYEFPNAWRMRVQRRRRGADGLIALELVAVAEKFPVVGSPTQFNQPLISATTHATAIIANVLDIAGVFPSTIERPGIFYAACATRGGVWRGAGVYSSIDGISYILRAVIEQQTPIGTAFTVLAVGDPAVIDWLHTVDVVLDYGELNDATLEQIATGLGTNYILIGNEILAFLQAELVGGSDPETDPLRYRLSGLVRGLRDTAGSIGSHVLGERVVLLDGLGVQGFSPFAGGYFEEFSVFGDIGQTRYFKIVPAGGALDDFAAVQVAPQANNVRPFTPGPVIQGDIITYDYDAPPSHPTYDPTAWNTRDIVVRWFRRTRSTLPIFGAGALEPLLEPIERYEVQVLKNGTVLENRTQIVGGVNSGSPFAHRIFRYTLAEQQADGWPSGTAAVILVRQIGVGGQFGYSPPSAIAWIVP